MTNDPNLDDDALDATYVKTLKTAAALEFTGDGICALVPRKNGKMRKHEVPSSVKGDGVLVVERNPHTRAFVTSLRDGDKLSLIFDGETTLDVLVQRRTGTKRPKVRTLSWRFDASVANKRDESSDEEDENEE